MNYIIEMRFENNKKSTYQIKAENETQAKERLMLRLPPKERNTIVIDSIKLDPKSVQTDDLYGIFVEE